MDLQKEIMDKLTECITKIKNLKINKFNIEELKYKLCPLSKDIDMLDFHIKDIVAVIKQNKISELMNEQQSKNIIKNNNNKDNFHREDNEPYF